MTSSKNKHDEPSSRRRGRGGAARRPSSSPPQPAPSSFDAWLASQGVWYNRALLDLRRDNDDSSSAPCAIYARTPITEGNPLALIPKDAVLSRRTSACSHLLEKQRLGGGLALTVAVMCELLRGERSRWGGYLRTLPWRTGEAGVPALWVEEAGDEEGEDDDDQGASATAPAPPTQPELLLAGTEAQGFARLDARDVARDYKTLVEPALIGTPARRRAWLAAVGGGSDNASSLPSLALFRRAASLVSSRAFRVDGWHGDAMVPVADAFNHKASCVSLGEGFVVTELQEQQEQEEAEERRQKKRPRPEDEEDEDEDDNGGNHGIPVASAAAAPPSVQSAAPPEAWRRWGLPLRLEIAIISDDEEGEEGEEEEEGGPDDEQRPAAPAELSSAFPGVLRIVAASDVPAGCEVRNTYGELANLDLVRKYGFCLRGPGPGGGGNAAGANAPADPAPTYLPPQAATMGMHRVSNPFDRVRLSPQAFVEGALALLLVGGGAADADADAAAADPAVALAAAAAAAAAAGRQQPFKPFLTREQLVERVAWLKSATDLLDAAVGEGEEEEGSSSEEEATMSGEGGGSDSGEEDDEEQEATEEEEEDDEEDDEDDEEEEGAEQKEHEEETPEQHAARLAADRACAERLVAQVAAAATSLSTPPASDPLPAQLLGDGAVAALPGAACSRAAFLVVRALSAPAEEFGRWRTVDDALSPGAALANRAAAERRRKWASSGSTDVPDPLAEAFSDEVPICCGGGGGGSEGDGGDGETAWPPAARALLAFALARRLQMYRGGGAGGAAANKKSEDGWWPVAAALLSADDASALATPTATATATNPKALAAASGLRTAEQHLLLHALCATTAN
jgi:SET domain-containing protein 6